MSSRAYIVPKAFLENSPPRAEWHATETPGDPSKSLVVVLWDNPNLEAEWEASPEVLPMGEPWEPAPPEAATLLSAPSTDVLQPVELAPSAPLLGEPAPSETVGSSLRRTGWPGARLVR